VRSRGSSAWPRAKSEAGGRSFPQLANMKRKYTGEGGGVLMGEIFGLAWDAYEGAVGGFSDGDHDGVGKIGAGTGSVGKITGRTDGGTRGGGGPCGGLDGKDVVRISADVGIVAPIDVGIGVGDVLSGTLVVGGIEEFGDSAAGIGGFFDGGFKKRGHIRKDGGVGTAVFAAPDFGDGIADPGVGNGVGNLGAILEIPEILTVGVGGFDVLGGCDDVAIGLTEEDFRGGLVAEIEHPEAGEGIAGEHGGDLGEGGVGAGRTVGRRKRGKGGVCVGVGGRKGCREGVKFLGVEREGLGDTAEVGGTVDAVCEFLGFSERREEDGDKESDNGDDNEEFDEGKAVGGSDESTGPYGTLHEAPHKMGDRCHCIMAEGGKKAQIRSIKGRGGA
jgi:hypothetical protein